MSGGRGLSAMTLLWGRDRRCRLASLAEPPEQDGRDDRADDGGAVAEENHELLQVLELQPIVERVAKTVGGVREAERAEEEEQNPHERIADDGNEVGVVGRRQPAQRIREAEEKEEDRHEKRGEHAARAEHDPQEGLDRSSRHHTPRIQRTTTVTTTQAP